MRTYFQSDLFRNGAETLKEQSKTYPNVAFEALNLAVPDLSHCAVEDILNLRYKARDELAEFRAYMDKLNYELEGEKDPQAAVFRAKQIVNVKIRPALNDLAGKVSSQEIKFAKTFLDQIKDPKSYVPLLGTFLVGIPSHLAIFLSLGLAGTRTVLDYLEGMQAVKQSGLYYLMTLRQQLGNK